MMTLLDLKRNLSTQKSLNFVLPNGDNIPAHFHITEVGLTTKHFVDCGGKIHIDKVVTLQIWIADDLEHRLKPIKLLNIINTYEEVLGGENLEVEVEYQNETISKYALGIVDDNYLLLAKQTDCLAQVKCNIPQPRTTINACTPGGGCC